MTRSVSNVVIATGTFAGWVETTNQLADSMSVYAVTADSTQAGANTSGNVNVIGLLSANNLKTEAVIGGEAGNTAAHAALSVGFSNSTVSSNVTVTGYSTTISSNSLTITSNTSVGDASQNVYVNVANLTVNTATFDITATSNIEIDSSVTITGDISVNNKITFTGEAQLYCNTIALTWTSGDNTTTNTITNVAISDYKSAKYTLNAFETANADNRSLTELIVVYGSSNAHITEYGSVHTGSQFITYSVSANATHFELLCNSAVNSTFNFIQTAFE